MKDVDPRVFTRMLQQEGRKNGRKDGRTDGRTDGSVIISLRNFVGEGIKRKSNTMAKGRRTSNTMAKRRRTSIDLQNIPIKLKIEYQ